MSFITRTNRSFTDLDLLFTANPITGDVSKKIDDAAIKRSLVHLVMLKPYEIPFSPHISCQANNLLFELDTPTTREIIKTSIIQVITKFEPRVRIIDVLVESADQGYSITIQFYIVGSEEPYSVKTLLQRTR